MSYKIEKMKNGKYRIRVWSVADEFGKIHTKQVSNINTASAARTKALEIEEDFKLNREIAQDYTFNQLRNLYETAKKNKLSPNTVNKKESYRNAVCEKWGNVKCRNINSRNMQDWVNELEEKENPNKKGHNLKMATIQEYVKVVTTTLNWGVSMGYIERNNIKKIEYREDEEDFEPTILTAEQLSEILKTLKQEYYNLYIPCLISLLADPRRGEVLALQTDDIDFENGLMFLRKNVYEDENGKVQIKNKLKSKTSRRTLALSNFLQRELQEHLEMNKGLNTTYICDNVFIGKVTPSYLTHKFHDFMRNRFGVNMRFHDLRHNFNQLCFENGVDLSTRSKMMGHSSEKITNRVYTHTSMKKSQEAVEKLINSLQLEA